MTHRRFHRLPLMALGAAVVASGPAWAQTAHTGHVRELVVRAVDFAFQAPDTVPSGPTTIRLINDGPDFHHVWLVKLEDGHTLQDMMAGMAEAHGPMPEWAVDVGGPNTPGRPGEETMAVLNLEPGNYAMICVIPAADGMLHLMKGMVRPLVVVPSGEPRAAMPDADITMTLVDYGFQLDTPITAGTHTIRVKNVAAQPHEVVIVRLEPGKTMGDFLQFVVDRQGPPPALPMGGTTGLAQGKENLITVTFTPGRYALYCFVPDAADGQPHFVHGMMTEFTVE